jgi:D-cysteine desulfhydrase
VGVVARFVVLAHDASLYQTGRTLRSIAAVFSPPPGRAAPRLFDAFPSMRGGVPWRPLCHVPTAVEPCDALTPWLGRGGVWAKRDDLISPVYGGNKVRRFEFLFADLAARNARRIVTAGGIASTQVMATARFGQALGIPVRAVLFDQAVTRFAREAVLTDVDAGAESELGNHVTPHRHDSLDEGFIDVLFTKRGQDGKQFGNS